MSSAAACAVRAGIREGSRSGAIGLESAAGGNAEIPTLALSNDAVIKNLQGWTLLKLEEKWHLQVFSYHVCGSLSIILARTDNRRRTLLVLGMDLNL